MVEPARRPARRRTRRRRITALCVGIVVLAGGAGTAWALTGSSGSAYRLASVERADVQQTVQADGTLSAEHRAVLSFAAGGMVNSVRVAVGDRVNAGEVVATLDPTALNSGVTSAQQTLADARQRLADDEDAQANGAVTTSSLVEPLGGGDPSGIQLATARFALPTFGSAAQQQIRAAQQAVVTAQHNLDAAVAGVGGDLDGLRSACTSGSPALDTQPVVADGTGTVSGTAGTSPEVAVLLTPDSTSANPQQVAAGATYTFAGLGAGGQYTLLLIPVAGADCTSALDTAAQDAAGLTTAKQALYTAIGQLTDALSAGTSAGNGADSGSPGRTGGGTGRSTTPSKGTSTKGTSGATSSRGTGNSASSGTGSGSGRTAGSTGSGATITAAQIAADAKTVDAAQAALALAQHDLGYATLTAPISGVVGAVTMQSGSAVLASSSSTAITIVGSGTLSAQVDVSLDEIDLVRVGETAQVTVDGRPAALPARVTYVGPVDASSSGSTASYPVTVSLDSTDSKLFDGMGASVAIDVGTARQALTVPLSAVHSTGRLVTVSVYANGTPTVQRVTLGVVGADRAQVTSGLKLGQQVVLADLNEAVPSSSTTLTRRGTGLGGLTGGGGFVGVGGRFTRVGGR